MQPLPAEPRLPAGVAARLAEDYERTATVLPDRVGEWIHERWGVDIAGEYAGRRIAVPFGKASGQLSLNLRQVERDAAAQLGFCVLKTAIAQDSTGDQSMGEWAIEATHMVVERIVGPRTGREGWTVTWKGRGWSESFERYLGLVTDCARSDVVGDMVVAASVKYHLPSADEPGFHTAEYDHTTRAIQAAWRAGRPEPLVLEKDFSPTLAGDDRSRARETILRWLREVPAVIRTAADGPLVLGVKVMNAVFDDDFQVEMLAACADADGGPADFLVYANRLFDPSRSFEDRRGVAYGGPDLSDRNLAVLAKARASGLLARLPPISATGDVSSGRLAVEYARRGALSFQMHTLFQLPDRCFDGRHPNKSERVLHRLLLHPVEGLVAWMLSLGAARLTDLPTASVGDG